MKNTTCYLSFVTDSIEDQQISIPGFSLFRHDRTYGGHGGVALDVRNELQPSLMSDLFDSDVELVFVRIHIGNSPCIVGSIYRVPNANSSYLDLIIKQIEKVSVFNTKTIIMGDFNLNIHGESKGNIVKEIEVLFQLTQLISDYTRVTSTSSTTLDLIFTNVPNKHIETGVIDKSASDHFFTFTTLSLKYKHKPKMHKYKRRRYAKFFNKELFLNDIVNSHVFNNIKSFNNVNIAWQEWKKEYLYLCNKHAPIRISHIKQVCNPWINDEILQLIYQRNFLHKKALFTNRQNDIFEFKKAKNRVTTTVKRTKKSFYSNKLFSSSPKDIWKIMKTVLPPKRDDFFDPNLNASTFNSFFSTIGNNLTNDLSDDNVIPLDNKSVKQFKFHDISISFICKCLASIKINSSIDILDMDAQLLRISSHATGPSLYHIYNLSLKTGCVPSDFKLARVTPIYKGKGNKSELGN